VKPIELSPHVHSRLASRGTNRAEIELAIREADWQSARSGRFECRKDFAFDSLWNGRHFLTKQVRPIFIDEPERIVVVTVYVYFF
jgi:hypothetical protein